MNKEDISELVVDVLLAIIAAALYHFCVEALVFYVALYMLRVEDDE